MAGFKSFNIKKVPLNGWLKIGGVLLIMILALIFTPEFTQSQVYWIAGGFGVIMLYVLLNITGVLGKIFNKKK